MNSKLIFKKSQICTIWGQSDPIWMPMASKLGQIGPKCALPGDIPGAAIYMADEHFCGIT